MARNDGWETVPSAGAWETIPDEEEEWEDLPTDAELRFNRDQAEAQSRYDEGSIPQKIVSGVDASLTQLGHGVAGLFGDQFVTPHQERNQRIRQGIQGGWQTVGEVGTELGTMLVPGGVIGKVASKGLPMALKASRAAPILADTALVSGYEGLKAPMEGETRGGNMAEGALYSMGAGALAKVAGGLAGRMGTVTDDARELQEYGMKLSPAQAREGAYITAENAMKYVPGYSRKVNKMQAPLLDAAGIPPSSGGKLAEGAKEFAKRKFSGMAGVGALSLFSGPAAAAAFLTRVGAINEPARQRLVGLAAGEQTHILNKLLNALPAGSLPNMASNADDRDAEKQRALARSLRGY